MNLNRHVMLRFMENKKRKQIIHEEIYDANKLFFSSYGKDDNIIPQITQAVVEIVISKMHRNNTKSRANIEKKRP